MKEDEIMPALILSSHNENMEPRSLFAARWLTPLVTLIIISFILMHAGCLALESQESGRELQPW